MLEDHPRGDVARIGGGQQLAQSSGPGLGVSKSPKQGVSRCRCDVLGWRYRPH
jgi:hypothetical protein